MKRCSKCEQTKPLDAFSRNKSKRDGRSAYCRKCAADYNRRYRIENLDRIREGRRKPERVKRARAYSRRYYRANKHRFRVWHKTRKAIEAGTLTLKSACERCGELDNLYPHHPDYSKPLEVTTLCARCHQRAHGRTLD